MVARAKNNTNKMIQRRCIGVVPSHFFAENAPGAAPDANLMHRLSLDATALIAAVEAKAMEPRSRGHDSTKSDVRPPCANMGGRRPAFSGRNIKVRR